MKKTFLFLTAVVLLLVCSACRQTVGFAKGNLLYDLGAKSFEDIEKVEFLYKEYQCNYGEKLEITQKEDVETLRNYKYLQVCPANELNELYIYPSNIIYVTVNGKKYELYLGKDASLTVVLSNSVSSARTYKAKDDNGFNEETWEKLIEKYSHASELAADPTPTPTITATPTVTPTTEPTAKPKPVEPKLEDLDTEALIKAAAKNLDVPEKEGITIKLGSNIYYWDAGERYMIEIDVIENGEEVAGAFVDPYTGELLRNIRNYPLEN